MNNNYEVFMNPICTHLNSNFKYNLLIFLINVIIIVTTDWLIKSPIVWLFNEITHIAIVVHPVCLYIPFDHIRLYFNLTLKGWLNRVIFIKNVSIDGVVKVIINIFFFTKILWIFFKGFL